MPNFTNDGFALVFFKDGQDNWMASGKFRGKRLIYVPNHSSEIQPQAGQCYLCKFVTYIGRDRALVNLIKELPRREKMPTTPVAEAPKHVRQAKYLGGCSDHARDAAAMEQPAPAPVAHTASASPAPVVKTVPERPAPAQVAAKIAAHPLFAKSEPHKTPGKPAAFSTVAAEIQAAFDRNRGGGSGPREISQLLAKHQEREAQSAGASN